MARAIKYRGFVIHVDQVEKRKWKCVTRKLNGLSIAASTGLYREITTAGKYDTAEKALDEARRQIDNEGMK